MPNGTHCSSKERRQPGHRENRAVDTPAPPTISWQVSVPEGEGVQPVHVGTASFQPIYTFPCLTPGSEPPRTNAIISTTFPPFSSYRTPLGSPSFPFWEVSLQQNAMQTQRCGNLFWGPIRKTAQLPRHTELWGPQEHEDVTHPAQCVPSSLTPKTRLLSTASLWPSQSTEIILSVTGNCCGTSGQYYLFPIYSTLPYYMLFLLKRTF